VILEKLVPKLFYGELRDDLITMTRILLLSPILLGFSNLYGSITQAHKKFVAYAISPILYNVGIIIGILFLYPYFGLAGLTFGVIIGALLHVCIQLPVLIESKLLPRLQLGTTLAQVKSVVLLSMPRTFTLAANQIALLVLVSLASFMKDGSIAIFNFSLNLQSVPLSIIGVSYSLAAFPTLSRMYARGEIDQFLNHLITAAKHIIFWSIPIATLFIVLRAQIVRTILESLVGQIHV
jgi:putative peptidoglycan lipid II flippase